MVGKSYVSREGITGDPVTLVVVERRGDPGFGNAVGALSTLRVNERGLDSVLPNTAAAGVGPRHHATGIGFAVVGIAFASIGIATFVGLIKQTG